MADPKKISENIGRKSGVLSGALRNTSRNPKKVPEKCPEKFSGPLSSAGGLPQSRWVETRGGWEEGEFKARGERWDRSPRSHFLSPALPLSSFFFHWCLLTGASAEERVSGPRSFRGFRETHARAGKGWAMKRACPSKKV